MMTVVKNNKRDQFKMVGPTCKVIISVELEETAEGEPVKSATGIEEEGKQGTPCDWAKDLKKCSFHQWHCYGIRNWKLDVNKNGVVETDGCARK